MKFLFNISNRCFAFGLVAFWLTVQLFPSCAGAAVPVNSSSGNLLNLDLKVFVAAKPIYFVLVEKDFQRLRVVKHDGRLNIVAEYFAVTGENFGRKQVEGDEKTPEGVYFITKSYVDKKISVFGNRAFHLNYPNIYDQIDGRDGNGIYIHGTNRELRTNSTNGCITLNNSDLDDLAQYLSVGSIPVIIVSSLYDEIASKGLYPNLTKNGFSLAKDLLVLDSKQDDFEFVNLFLIRAAGQTVVVGEYKSGNVASRTLYSAAYLDISQEKGWFVADRAPGSDKIEMIAEEVVPAVEDVVAKTKSVSFLEQEAWSELWEPKNEDIYLSWYRDSLAKSQAIVDSLVDEGQNRSVTSADESGSTFDLSYGLIILAACISIGSVLILKRAQPRREAVSQATDLRMELTEKQLIKEQQIKLMQEEIDQAKESLRLVQEHMQEEKSLMEKDLQAKIEELEAQLEDKQAEIDHLATEKAALQLKGMSHLSGQVEELTSLRSELKEVTAQLDEARRDSARVPILESMISAQKEETNRLAAENAAWKVSEAEAAANRKGDLQTLQNQIVALQTELQEENERRRLNESKVAAAVSMENDLLAAREEAAKLRHELQSVHEANPQSELEQEITALRGRLSIYKTELAVEREKQEQLSAKLAAAHEVEETLSARSDALAQLENENQRLKEELAAKDHEDELSRLKERLADYEAEMESKSEEAAQLVTQLQASQASQEELLSEKSEVIHRLEAENSRIKEQLETKDNDEGELSQLRKRLSASEQDLLAEQSHAKELTEQLAQAQQVEEKLAASKAEIERIEAENDALRNAADRSDLQEELVSLRDQLSEKSDALDQERTRKSSLESRLSRLNELEEFVLARQVEVTSLTNQLKELKAKELSSAEQIASLQSQLDSLQQTLEDERAQRVEVVAVPAEPDYETPVEAVHETLYADEPQPQAQSEADDQGAPVVSEDVAAPAPKPAAASVDESLLSHGTQFLPEDVLKKWIGQG